MGLDHETGARSGPVLSERSTEGRAKEMAALGRSQGWRFTPENPELVPLVQRLPEATGHARDVVLSGVMRMEPAQGTGAGRAALAYLHTVWAIPLPRLPFCAQAASRGQPHDAWRPGHAFRTDDEAFDKRCLTTADDAAHVHTGLSPQTILLPAEAIAHSRGS
ncbi:hypothetical protein [Spirillospora sp. NPDC048819]|uniref:hypothetical protein n=1 Tax=Spirillospora sp. NPDC048819 TaxID=3155268 RepID=UPI00340C73AF